MDLDRVYTRMYRTLFAALLLCILVDSSPIYAQDGGPIIIGEHERLKFFGLENYRVSLEAFWRYRSDESTESTGTKTNNKESLFRESLIFSGEGFLGNPNLVKLNLSAKLRLSQEKLNSDTTGIDERTVELIDEYDLSAVILQRSDTPLTIYSKRSQILLDRQFTDSLDSINTEYGARLTLRNSIMPSQFQYFHREQEQSGRFSGTDSQLSQDTFAWHGRITPINGHRIWWDYTFSSITESGMLVVPNSFNRHDAFFNHTYNFGSESRNDLRSSIRLYKETGKFPVERFRWSETLNLEHTRNFETKYIYMFDQQKRRNTTQKLNSAIASFQHDLFDSLTTTGQIGASRLTISEGNFESTQLFGDLGLKYQKIVPYGLFNATADYNFNQTDDSARGSSIFITDEPHIFGPTGLISLSRRNIIASSILVKDSTGIIIYVEGADYTVVLFGESTEIRRVVGGNIAAGQAVLITYEIGPEPKTKTDTTGYGITIRYRIEEGPLKGLSPYIRYRDQKQSRTSLQILDNPQNDFQDLVFGIDYDLGRLSFTAERQIHDSTISPFETNRFEGRYINRLNARNSLSFTAYYQEIDRTDDNLLTSVSNVTARWNAQATDRLKSSLVGTWRSEEDNSGSNSDAYEIALDMTWRHRQTTVYCTMRNSIINSNTRDNTFQTLLIGIRRDF